MPESVYKTKKSSPVSKKTVKASKPKKTNKPSKRTKRHTKEKGGGLNLFQRSSNDIDRQKAAIDMQKTIDCKNSHVYKELIEFILVLYDHIKVIQHRVTVIMNKEKSKNPNADVRLHIDLIGFINAFINSRNYNLKYFGIPLQQN